MLITSTQNERVKLIRALQKESKTRRKERKIALEGVRLIGDAVAAGVMPEFVLHSAEAVAHGKPGAELVTTLERYDIPTFEITPEVLTHIADTETPQGILAVVPMPELPAPPRLTSALILDAVADPGNLGTILRTAAASGVDVVLLAPGCVDAFNPKVLRGGMGAHFRVPVIRGDWEMIGAMCADLRVYLADADGETTHFAVDWREPSALIIGGEARGAEQHARAIAHSVISIPMANESESLNAAIATGVILFEMRRQRLTGVTYVS
jgi:RNA methyltransferase, TrmH family